MNFHDALKKLHHARRKLSVEQGRIGRRNARRAVLGAIQSLRHALDAEFPPLGKPKPEKVTPIKPIKLTFPKPERHPFQLPYGQLFADLISNLCNTRPIAVSWSNSAFFKQDACLVFIPYDRSDAMQWSWLMKELADLRHAKDNTPATIAVLYHRFWREVLPVDDIQLAARHQAFLDQHGVKP